MLPAGCPGAGPSAVCPMWGCAGLARSRGGRPVAAVMAAAAAGAAAAGCLASGATLMHSACMHCCRPADRQEREEGDVPAGGHHFPQQPHHQGAHTRTDPRQQCGCSSAGGSSAACFVAACPGATGSQLGSGNSLWPIHRCLPSCCPCLHPCPHPPPLPPPLSLLPPSFCRWCL